MDKYWLTKKCKCGISISYNANRCRSCAKKGNLNPAKKQEVRDKISKTMKSLDKREQVMKMQRAGVKAVKELSLKRFIEGSPRIKIGKRGYLMVYIPELSDYKFKKGSRYYHHYIWETFNQRALLEGCCIHHKDGNKMNNLIDNLEFMTIEQHDKLPNHGKRSLPKSEETKSKISNSLRGVRHTKERTRNQSIAQKKYHASKKSKNSKIL